MFKKLMFIFAACILFISMSAFAQTQEAKSTFTPDQQKDIEKIVHDYLVSHPKILIEVATALQKEQQAAWQETAKKVVPQSAKSLFTNDKDPVVGNPKGDVTIVEFFDYECPHCKEMAPQISALVKADNNLRVIYKPLPIFGSMSIYAAKAGLAAAKQGKFAEFHEALMGVSVDPLTQDIILKVAQQVGLNVKQLKEDMNDPKFDEEFKQNDALARSLQLTGTPAFVIAKVQGENVQDPILIPGAVPTNILSEAITKVRSGKQ